MNWFTALLAAAVLIGTFQAGKVVGRREVHTSTIVRVGSPFLLGRPYFGECAYITHHLKTIDFEACATTRDE